MNSKYLNRKTNSDLFQLARQNRKVSTEAEAILWNHLRGRKLKGYKFRRQQPMGGFILDFFCLDTNIAIEVDGGYHDEATQKIYDEQRTSELNQLHITILRFTNDDVINKTQQVLDVIVSHLMPRPASAEAASKDKPTAFQVPLLNRRFQERDLG